MRNTLLAVRLLRFHSVIPDIKLNIRGREKQLFKPVLRVFQKTQIMAELLPVISNYVIQKREANRGTLYAFLYRVVRDLIKNQIKNQQGTQLGSAFIWDYIRQNLPGADIIGKPLSYDTSEFGVLTQKEITQTLEHIFGAKAKKSHGNIVLQFDLSKLKRLGNVYDLTDKVKVIEGEESGEDREDVGIGKYIAASTKESEKIGETQISEHESTPDNGPTDLVHPPQVPYPPPTLPPSYDDLVITEDMPITGKTAYRCKEHPERWYTDLKGLEISHFVPEHGKPVTAT